jgi:putative addiction module component (TIGR02574 family)
METPRGKDGLTMDAATERVYQAALALPDHERMELVEALLASENWSSEPPFDLALLQEVRRRSAEIDSGTVQTSHWSAVRERVRRRLEGPSGG